MQSLLGTSLGVFVGLTVILIGGSAILAGRSIAENWKPAWQVVLACLGLALADRFLMYALFNAPLLTLRGFLLNFAIIALFGLTAWRLTRASKMVRQYPWKYRRTSPFSWAEHNSS